MPITDIEVLKLIGPRDEIILDGVYTDGFFLSDHNGMSGLPSKRWSQSSIFQVGNTDIGRKVGSRTLTVSFNIRGEDREDLERNRRRLSSLLIPDTTPLGIEVTGHDNLIRTGSGFVVKPPDLNTKDRLGHLMRDRFQMTMPDPLFYGSSGELNITGTASKVGFELPMMLPTELGGSGWGGESIVRYNGTWSARPTVTLFGPLSSVEVENETTGGVLKLSSSYSLPAGYVFLFQPGRLDQVFTLIDDTGARTNGIGRVDIDTDLERWHLEPGFNVVSVSATGQGANSAAVISWTEAFEGI